MNQLLTAPKVSSGWQLWDSSQQSLGTSPSQRRKLSAVVSLADDSGQTAVGASRHLTQLELEMGVMRTFALSTISVKSSIWMIVSSWLARGQLDFD